MTEYRIDLASAIAKIRVKKGLSQADLAKKTGMSASYISRLECGTTREPRLETLCKIANAFDIHILTLLDQAITVRHKK